MYYKKNNHHSTVWGDFGPTVWFITHHWWFCGPTMDHDLHWPTKRVGRFCRLVWQEPPKLECLLYSDFSATGVLSCFCFFKSSPSHLFQKRPWLVESSSWAVCQEPQVGLLKQEENGRIHTVESWKFIPLFSDRFCIYQMVGRILSINGAHFHNAYTPFQKSRFSRNESLQDKDISPKRCHSRLQWLTCRGFAKWNDSNV